MSSTKYSYSISADFPNGTVASDKLEHEITESSIKISVDYVGTVGNVCDIWFKAELTEPEQATLNAVVAAHDGVPLVSTPPKTTPDNKLIVQVDPLEASTVNLFTHDWTDKTTWYTESERLADDLLVDSGDHTTYAPEQQRPWVDVTHGKLFQERELREQYAPVIKVNGTAKVENPPETTAGDYTINYLTGVVTFNQAQASNAVVTADYSYVCGSKFVIRPEQGKKLRIDEVEIQFSKDIVMNDSLIYQVRVSDGQGGHVPYGSPEIYQTLQDFIDDATKSHPIIPKLGGNNWRAMRDDIIIFAFDYKSTRDLLSSYGLEVEARLENDIPFGGSMCVATFYCLSISE